MTSSNLVRARIVSVARQWLGTPYRHQASKRGVGCDCLGLVRGVWRSVEGHEPVATPAYSNSWFEASGEETLLEMAHAVFAPVHSTGLRPGDVLVFRMRRGFPAKHLGIAVGETRFIHAYEASCVVESQLDAFWSKRIAGCFTFPSVAQIEAQITEAR